jgi:hypothetical protein
MNSFTSSSNPSADREKVPGAIDRPPATSGRARFALWRIVAVLLVCLATLEFTIVKCLVPKSKDLANIITFPQRAARLAGSSGTRLAVLGNSAVYRGIDGDLLSRVLQEHGMPGAHAETFPIDDSAMPDWYCAAERYLWQDGASPDVMVVCFFHQQLADNRPSQPGRMARFLAAPRDWRVLSRSSIRTLDDRIDFAISSCWTSYAMRPRIRERFLEVIVPSYKAFVLQENAAEIRRREHQRPAAPGKPSYELLCHLIASAQAHRTRLIFVAFPRRPDPRHPESPIYDIDEDVVRLVRAEGMEFLDMRKVDGLKSDQYMDFVHLKEEGKVRFSKALGQRLSELLRR